METFVTLPQPLQVAITALIVFVVGWVFTQIGKAIPWLAGVLGQYVDEVALTVAGMVVLYVQELLNMIPAQYDNIVSIVLELIIAVLASLGLFKVLAKAGVRSFKH